MREFTLLNYATSLGRAEQRIPSVRAEHKEVPLTLDAAHRGRHKAVQRKQETFQWKSQILFGHQIRAANESRVLTKVHGIWTPSSFELFPSYILQKPVPVAARSTAARLLRSWVRIPPGALMFVCCVCCVLSGRGLCDELITRLEESYRLCHIVVGDQETSWTRRP
jgi:hypothetical protein